jgi:hypothetical protein
MFKVFCQSNNQTFEKLLSNQALQYNCSAEYGVCDILSPYSVVATQLPHSCRTLPPQNRGLGTLSFGVLLTSIYYKFEGVGSHLNSAQRTNNQLWRTL